LRISTAQAPISDLLSVFIVEAGMFLGSAEEVRGAATAAFYRTSLTLPERIHT
jgi:hypothetical protein